MKIKYGKYFEIDANAHTLRFVGERASTKEEAWKITLDKWRILSSTDRYLSHSCVITCGLCQRYMYRPGFPGCDGCPIALDGHRTCECTPYLGYSKNAPFNKSLKAAKAELKYLKKLYKKDKLK